MTKDTDIQLTELHQQMRQAKEKGRLAFLLGNGINMYATDGDCPSWKGLVKRISEEVKSDHTVDEGYTLTELFDILRIHHTPDTTDADITKCVQKLVRELYPCDKEYYQFLSERLKAISAPVLTTNFDTNLEIGLRRQVTPIRSLADSNKLISDIYHWNEYYAKDPIADEDMERNFSVWHIHGNVEQKKTIRLDLSAYMGQVTYTRNFLQDKAHLWAVLKDGDPWGMPNKGMKEGEALKVDGYAFTWLNIFYNSAICINGLGLSTDETYLRWLFISRFKYQKRIGIEPKGWYIYGWRDTVTEGMKAFLRGVGIEPVYIDSDDARYRDLFDF